MAAAVPWVVEPTGGYELALVAFAHEAGWAISLPNPRQVRQWAKGGGPLGAALVGLDPQPYESGRSVRQRSSISKMGNAT
ncbi:MAG: hypothetical protein DCC55_21950, partial [Chloroflexi bacterium]